MYAVDDEPLLLSSLRDAIAEAEPAAQIRGFANSRDVLLALQEGDAPDAAFLDIELPGMDGIELARRIKLLSPRVWIVFVTGYSQYAMEAIKLHAQGYIMKPVTADSVRAELRAPVPPPLARSEGKRVKVVAFGSFEVFVDDEPVRFTRKKAKELFAYLVHRKGAVCTARELAAVIFEDTPYSKKQMNYFQQIVASMREAFASRDASDVLELGYDRYAVNVDMLDCDYYRYAMGKDSTALSSYAGEYMTQYGWAEFTSAFLNRLIN